jgi:hypothetical protein
VVNASRSFAGWVNPEVLPRVPNLRITHDKDRWLPSEDYLLALGIENCTYAFHQIPPPCLPAHTRLTLFFYNRRRHHVGSDPAELVAVENHAADHQQAEEPLQRNAVQRHERGETRETESPAAPDFERNRGDPGFATQVAHVRGTRELG